MIAAVDRALDNWLLDGRLLIDSRAGGELCSGAE